ncbi:MAG: FYDLN acid domain-containing protein [Alphaproteobacteria bacterium]|nr:FYDLN acid domain-containing protein [Alphaproteobacteria bacterium]
MSAVAKASDPKGLKRVCSSCGIRFYDLNKRPITCPGCATEFTGEIKVKARRSRLPVDEVATTSKTKNTIADMDDDTDDIADDAQVISLDDLNEGADDDDDDVADTDLALDDDDDIEVLDDDLEDDLDSIEPDADLEDDEDDKD